MKTHQMQMHKCTCNAEPTTKTAPKCQFLKLQVNAMEQNDLHITRTKEVNETPNTTHLYCEMAYCYALRLHISSSLSLSLYQYLVSHDLDGLSCRPNSTFPPLLYPPPPPPTQPQPPGPTNKTRSLYSLLSPPP